MRPLRQTLTLSQGTVTLEMWSATTQEANFMDILRIVAVLLAFYDEDHDDVDGSGTPQPGRWLDFKKTDVNKPVWDAFWRLIRASLTPGSELPRHMSFGDRLTLLESIRTLNDLSDARKKLLALSAGMQETLLVMEAVNLNSPTQGQTTTPLTNS